MKSNETQTQEATMIPEYLDSACAKKTDVCMGCETAVKQNPTSKRWFITMGHPGFNNFTNNRNGYRTRKAAVTAVAEYSIRRMEAMARASA